MLLLLITPMGVALSAPKDLFYAVTLAAYAVEVAALWGIGPVARAVRARQFQTPAERGSVSEIRLMLGAVMALTPLAVTCAGAWRKEERWPWVAGACVTIALAFVKLVRAWRRYTLHP
jgi:hypothetical protein